MTLIAVALAPAARGASVSAGSAHSAVVKTTDNTAWMWGLNTNGRLGDGSTMTRLQPIQVPSLADVVAVAAGGSHTLVLKTDATVWAFGYNGQGQLGFNSTATQSLTPVAVVGITGAVVGIAAGDSHSLAWTSDGKLYAWGNNGDGQLGLGDTTLRRQAVQVSVGGSPSKLITHASAGSFHSLAVTSETTMFAWGRNGSGRLGNGNTTQQTSPVAVVDSLATPVTGFASVSAGGQHSLGRKSDGTCWGWGANSRGQLGNASTSASVNPVQTSGLSSVVAISAGTSHSLAIDSDGIAFAWGENNEGQLGDDGASAYVTLPQVVPGINSVVSVVAASNHSLAVTASNVVWSWGRNGSAQLGDGTTLPRLSPVAICEPGFVWKAGTPVVTPGGGAYSSDRTVTLSSATSGATLRYTSDGSEPSGSSTLYSSSFQVTQSATIKARAFKAGLPDSNVGGATYTLQTAQPTVTPGAGTYTTPQNVSMSTSTPGATVRYTMDGSDPNPSSPAYATPVLVDAGVTLVARTFKTGWTTSTARTAVYTMKVGTPSVVPAAGSYSATQQVTPSSVTPGATLRYRIDGIEPVPGDPVVPPGGLAITQSSSLKLKGWRAGWVTSDTTTATYLLSLGTVAAPSVSPAAGSYAVPQTITLATSTPGALIHYTLDGSTPSLQSPIFGAPFVVASTTTVKARAYRADMTPSTVTSAAYTLTSSLVAAPELSVASGFFTTARTVTISVATPGATLHYTTSGADPTEGDPVIASGGTLLVDRAAIVKVRAWVGANASAIARRDYVITGAIAAGGSHTLALKADGTVWAAGLNGSGQLGDTSTLSRSSPVQVAGLTDVVAIAAGGNHSLALKSDGTVVAWGGNTSGQLGDGSNLGKSSPVAISGLTGVVAIAAGADHSLAVKSDGTVAAWGNNGSGRLGDNSTTSRNAPVAVSGLTGALSVAGGMEHSLALKVDGSVVAWGANWTGQLGDTSTLAKLVPVNVAGPSGIAKIVAGGYFSLAAQGNDQGHGALWTWGRNMNGELGDGTLVARSVPLATLPAAALLAAGQSHSLALAPNGRLLGWGLSSYGQVGDGTSGSSRNQPTPVATLEALSVSGGDLHSVALAADGRLYSWGHNGSGRLANGTTTNRSWPAPAGTFRVAENDWLATDPDGDGLVNAAEYRLGTDPLNSDTNGDGLPDGIEAALGLRPFDPDTDGDGLSNLVEESRGTSPFDADSDDDGTPDGLDAFPLDPTRWQSVADPNDHTAPNITLLEPVGAVVLP